MRNVQELGTTSQCLAFYHDCSRRKETPPHPQLAQPSQLQLFHLPQAPRRGEQVVAAMNLHMETSIPATVMTWAITARGVVWVELEGLVRNLHLVVSTNEVIANFRVIATSATTDHQAPVDHLWPHIEEHHRQSRNQREHRSFASSSWQAIAEMGSTVATSTMPTGSTLGISLSLERKEAGVWVVVVGLTAAATMAEVWRCPPEDSMWTT